MLIAGGGALAALHISGVLLPFIESDATRIVPALITIAALCTIWARPRDWVVDQQICPTLGLLGTVLGFMVALAGIEGDITADKLGGVTTALTTTAAGIIAHIWLLVVREVR